MRICLISVEIFAWGKFGGFGKATRMLGRELVKRGHEVYALIPQRQGQQKVEILDGITVYGYRVGHPIEMVKMFKYCAADLYHSQEPSFATWLALKLHPQSKHVITFRDTRLASDWWIELLHYSASIWQVLANFLYEDNILVHRAVHRANALFAASNYVAEKARRKYHLETLPEFLPTPVEIPEQVEKNPNPTVCYVSRWDRRKRPELLIKLAKAHPEVQFLAAGGSRDARYDQKIRSQLEALPNVEIFGMVNQFENDALERIYGQSWILLNTSLREGMPISFIEACGARCALLSSVNPDRFCDRFGYWAKNNDFVDGLDALLEKGNWNTKGQAGYQSVSGIFSIQNAIDRHIQVYSALTG